MFDKCEFGRIWRTSNRNTLQTWNVQRNDWNEEKRKEIWKTFDIKFNIKHLLTEKIPRTSAVTIVISSCCLRFQCEPFRFNFVCKRISSNWKRSDFLAHNMFHFAHRCLVFSWFPSLSYCAFLSLCSGNITDGKSLSNKRRANELNSGPLKRHQPERERMLTLRSETPVTHNRMIIFRFEKARILKHQHSLLSRIILLCFGFPFEFQLTRKVCRWLDHTKTQRPFAF